MEHLIQQIITNQHINPILDQHFNIHQFILHKIETYSEHQQQLLFSELNNQNNQLNQQIFQSIKSNLDHFKYSITQTPQYQHTITNLINQIKSTQQSKLNHHIQQLNINYVQRIQNIHHNKLKLQNTSKLTDLFQNYSLFTKNYEQLLSIKLNTQQSDLLKASQLIYNIYQVLDYEQINKIYQIDQKKKQVLQIKQQIIELNFDLFKQSLETGDKSNIKQSLQVFANIQTLSQQIQSFTNQILKKILSMFQSLYQISQSEFINSFQQIVDLIFTNVQQLYNLQINLESADMNSLLKFKDLPSIQKQQYHQIFNLFFDKIIVIVKQQFNHKSLANNIMKHQQLVRQQLKQLELKCLNLQFQYKDQQVFNYIQCQYNLIYEQVDQFEQQFKQYIQNQFQIKQKLKDIVGQFENCLKFQEQLIQLVILVFENLKLIKDQSLVQTVIIDYTNQVVEVVDGNSNALVNIFVVDQLLKDIISYLIEQKVHLDNQILRQIVKQVTRIQNTNIQNYYQQQITILIELIIELVQYQNQSILKYDQKQVQQIYQKQFQNHSLISRRNDSNVVNQNSRRQFIELYLQMMLVSCLLNIGSKDSIYQILMVESQIFARIFMKEEQVWLSSSVQFILQIVNYDNSNICRSSFDGYDVFKQNVVLLSIYCRMDRQIYKNQDRKQRIKQLFGKGSFVEGQFRFVEYWKNILESEELDRSDRNYQLIENLIKD